MAMSTMMRSKIAQTTMILRLNMTRNTREDVILSLIHICDSRVLRQTICTA